MEEYCSYFLKTWVAIYLLAKSCSAGPGGTICIEAKGEPLAGDKMPQMAPINNFWREDRWQPGLKLCFNSETNF